MNNGWFRRKTIQGGQGIGLIPAMLMFAVPLVIVGLILWRSPFGTTSDMGGPKPKVDDLGGPVAVGDIAAGAKSFSTVKDEERKKTDIEKSDRKTAAEVMRSDESATKTTVEEKSDALTLAISEPQETKPEKDSLKRKIEGEEGVAAQKYEGEDDGIYETSPGSSGRGIGGATSIERQMDTDGARSKTSGKINTAELVIFRAVKKSANEGAKGDGAKASTKPTGQILPRGTKIHVYFIETVNTLDIESMVTLAVAEPVVFNHKVVIPFGTRLLGRASNKSTRDRIAIDVDTLLFPDGREVGISGLMKDMDGQSGVTGYYIPRPAMAQLAPYIGGFLQAYAGNLLAGKTTVNVLGTGVTTEASATKNEFMNQAAKMIGEQVKLQQQELTDRSPPYVVVVAGSEAVVQLRTAFNLTDDAGNAAARSRPLAPGFENTPYRADGSLQLPTAVIKDAAQAARVMTSTLSGAPDAK